MTNVLVLFFLESFVILIKFIFSKKTVYVIRKRPIPLRMLI